MFTKKRNNNAVVVEYINGLKVAGLPKLIKPF